MELDVGIVLAGSMASLSQPSLGGGSQQRPENYVVFIFSIRENTITVINRLEIATYFALIFYVIIHVQSPSSGIPM